MSEPSKVEVDNFADESQDLNDSKINGWTRRSLKDMESHLDIVSDEELEYDERWKKGLDYYI